MLIILSDLHLGDGSCGQSISADAFHLFADRLDEMAMRASWRDDGSYRPIDQINILLLGDILDPLNSELWLETDIDSPDYTRPWTSYKAPAYGKILQAITRRILKENAEKMQVLKELKVLIPRVLKSQKNWRDDEDLVDVPIRLKYMIGNHDWYYGIPGKPEYPLFDEIRAEVVDAMGLAQDSSPFPYEPEDDPELEEMLAKYNVYAIHGDKHDSFNYDPTQKTRIHSGLGDIFTVEMLNRFPLEVKRQLPNIPQHIAEKFCELIHVRPALASTLWIGSQIKHNNLPDEVQTQIKELWEEMGKEFLSLDAVKKFDISFDFDSVDKLQLALRVSKLASFQTINDLALWVQEKFWGGPISFSKKALKEPAFKDESINYIVYGHTHHHEVVPLDTEESREKGKDRIYFNSGTWNTYLDLTIKNPYEQKFVPYQVATYLLFYKDGEHKGRRYETLSSVFS